MYFTCEETSLHQFQVKRSICVQLAFSSTELFLLRLRGYLFFCVLVFHVFETKSYHVTQTGFKGMAAASAQLPKCQSDKHNCYDRY